MLAVDSAQRMLALAARHAHQRVRYLQADIESLHLPAYSADCVISSLVMHCVRDYPGLIRRMIAWPGRIPPVWVIAVSGAVAVLIMATARTWRAAPEFDHDRPRGRPRAGLCADRPPAGGAGHPRSRPADGYGSRAGGQVVSQR